jgi:hypothetical protein
MMLSCAGPPRSDEDNLAGSHRPVGGQHDAQALHRIGHVIGQIEIVVDRLQ